MQFLIKQSPGVDEATPSQSWTFGSHLIPNRQHFLSDARGEIGYTTPMKSPETGNDESGLSNLEMLGVLSSKIIHDLKNKLAVITGHAQFAEMTKQDPKAMAHSLAVIRRVSEEAAKHVDNLAQLRRRLPVEVLVSESTDIHQVLANAQQKFPGWTCTNEQPTSYPTVAILPQWLGFILNSFLGQLKASSGTIDIDVFKGELPMENVEISPLIPERRFLRIRLGCSVPETAPEPVKNGSIAQFKEFAVQELIKRLEGGLLVHKTGADVQTIILLPLAAQQPQPTGTPPG